MTKPALAVAMVLLGIAACSKERMPAAEKDGASAPTASASSASSANARWDEMVPDPQEAPKLPASWTDPKVVAALAESCEYRLMRPLPPNIGDLRPNRFAGSGPTLIPIMLAEPTSYRSHLPRPRAS